MRYTIIAEYIWLGGSGELRAKTKIFFREKFVNANQLDVSNYPKIIFELLKRDYNEEEIEKICYKNLFRVWNEVLDYSNN